MSPDVVRRLAWTPPEAPDSAHVAAALAAAGARPWQVELATPGLTDAMAATVASVAQDTPAPVDTPNDSVLR